MMGLKIGLLVSTIGLGIAFPLATLIDEGAKLGTLSVGALLGIVALASISAMVYLYRDKTKESREHTQQLIDMVKENTSTSKEVAEAIRVQNSISVDVKDTLIGCKHNQS